MKQNKVFFGQRYVVNICIVYELDTWSGDLNTDFTLKDSFFGAFKLTKNAISKMLLGFPADYNNVSHIVDIHK